MPKPNQKTISTNKQYRSATNITIPFDFTNPARIIYIMKKTQNNLKFFVITLRESWYSQKLYFFIYPYS